MRVYGPILLLAAVLVCFGAWAVRAQQHAEGNYQLVSLNQGPYLYRLNRDTGEICAILALDMKYAWRGTLKLCPDVMYEAPPKKKTSE